MHKKTRGKCNKNFYNKKNIFIRRGFSSIRRGFTSIRKKRRKSIFIIAQKNSRKPG